MIQISEGLLRDVIALLKSYEWSAREGAEMLDGICPDCRADSLRNQTHKPSCEYAGMITKLQALLPKPPTLKKGGFKLGERVRFKYRDQVYHGTIDNLDGSPVGATIHPVDELDPDGVAFIQFVDMEHIT